MSCNILIIAESLYRDVIVIVCRESCTVPWVTLSFPPLVDHKLTGFASLSFRWLLSLRLNPHCWVLNQRPSSISLFEPCVRLSSSKMKQFRDIESPFYFEDSDVASHRGQAQMDTFGDASSGTLCDWLCHSHVTILLKKTNLCHACICEPTWITNYDRSCWPCCLC